MYYPNYLLNYNCSYPQSPGLNGKVVDNVDVARAADIPIGGYGVYPKGDFSEIYVKSWNNNGTSTLVQYKPVKEEIPEQPQDIMTLLKEIDGKLNLLTKPKEKEEIKNVPANQF